jgi:flagellar biosynthesis/type III secretory pathway ATPase
MFCDTSNQPEKDGRVPMDLIRRAKVHKARKAAASAVFGPAVDQGDAGRKLLMLSPDTGKSRISLESGRDGDYQRPAAAKAGGRILAVHGPVVDVGFAVGDVPSLHEALRVADRRGALLLEVQQLLGPRTVRSIALGRTDGMARGLAVERTGRGIQVPVGPATLGRMFNALGEPLDGQAPPAATQYWPIHRSPPPFTTDHRPLAFLETGIKIIDLLAPVARAGTTGIIGGAGVGKTTCSRN